MKTSYAFGKNTAFTLIELLVVIAIIGVLASIITPAANSAVRKAKSTQCRTNLSQISKVILNYAIDHQGRYP
ncbi:MAG: prepilin-type N-terminal cleavage/methylation domain-containing protein, partial [Kiritimatiellales bacterium]|nr:prepilin-type N-terminal cleavage/methylation domain-containing protein [Kiritimatiellales bacterium]